MELSSVSAFEEDAELNGFEGTDMKDMRLEAEAVVNDVLFAVNTMFVSKTLRCADDVAYINVETRERNRYCLELTEAGLRVNLSDLGMETDCNPMELSSVSAFEEDAELNGFEGTDMKDMRLEAEAVVNDVLFAVNTMFVSKTLRCADDVAYINVETRERNRYCLELTEAGLRVVGYAFDQVDDHLQTPYHETVYSLLDTLSPAYREAFGNALLQRLEALKRDGQS
ncbi:GSK3-beta interaction protein, partial [Eschrichtius robustus]|nr:GSK3-beta interaction protein [Eschrichtius robustus]